jgi:hypothetical protein
MHSAPETSHVAESPKKAPVISDAVRAQDIDPLDLFPRVRLAEISNHGADRMSAPPKFAAERSDLKSRSSRDKLDTGPQGSVKLHAHETDTAAFCHFEFLMLKRNLINT